MTRIAIIGGGFSGCLVAAHLLRSAGSKEVILIERRERAGEGMAYGTTRAEHLLNVPAGNMSAFADDTSHFVAWAQRQFPDLGVTGGSFLPRPVYGQYLKALLEEARSKAGTGTTLTTIHDEVMELEASDAQTAMRLRSGRGLLADRAVLATGNAPPGDPLRALLKDHSHRYIRDPWHPGALDAVDDGEPALLIGTGLTMYDVALSLSTSFPQRRMIAISRHGLLPQPHRPHAKAPDPHLKLPVEKWPRTVRGMLRALREEVEAARSRGTDWRELVTALRPVTQKLWGELNDREKSRFMAHVRHVWDSHRHRAAPGPAGTIRILMEDGLLSVHAARVGAVQTEAAGFHVDLLLRGRNGERLRRHVGWIVNCTGPCSDYTQLDDPLIASLRKRGLIHPDPHGLGIVTAPDGAVMNVKGRASKVIFAAGPMRKAQLWENTAVPELRVQAAAVARSVMGGDERARREDQD